MKLQKVLLFLLIVLLSCGNDDNNSVSDEPDSPNSSQSTGKYPLELVGTWMFYSGNPLAVLSSIDGNDIMNQNFIIAANGNLSESIVYLGQYELGKSSSFGNWMVDNKQLKFTDWYGNIIDRTYSYRIHSDASLTLTTDGHTAVYYKLEDIKSKYAELLVGSWHTVSRSNRLSFYNTGRGYSETYYKDGIYYGGEPFSWSCTDSVLSIDYDNFTGSWRHREYVIDYLNKKSAGWNGENYVRE